MDGAQVREFHVPRFGIAIAVIALFAAVLAPTAGATSPSQDQYGSAIPGAGTGSGSGSGGPSTSSSPSGTAESTIPVAPSTTPTTPTTSSEATSASTGSGGN